MLNKCKKEKVWLNISSHLVKWLSSITFFKKTTTSIVNSIYDYIYYYSVKKHSVVHINASAI